MMPTTTPNPPPLPTVNVPFVDPKSGCVTPDWYKWLAFWDRVWRQLRKEIP